MPHDKGLGAYSKIKALGAGSFGDVYLVKEVATGARAVLKEVELKGLASKYLKAAHDEVTVLQRMKHHHIIGYRDSSVQGSLLLIVMEFADGGDLGNLIRQQEARGEPLAEDRVRKIVAQAVDALAYCHHTLHLLHRDLKPDNIFLTAAGDVKVGDFGVAKTLLATNAMAQTKCGTPLFMSPELMSGMPYDRSADVWAFGCVLYNVLTLAAPWIDRVSEMGGMMALMRLVCHSELDLNRVQGRYSAELISLLEQLLSKRAAERPSFKDVIGLPFVQSALTGFSQFPRELTREPLVPLPASAPLQPQPQPQPQPRQRQRAAHQSNAAVPPPMLALALGRARWPRASLRESLEGPPRRLYQRRQQGRRPRRSQTRARWHTDPPPPPPSPPPPPPPPPPSDDQGAPG